MSPYGVVLLSCILTVAVPVSGTESSRVSRTLLSRAHTLHGLFVGASVFRLIGIFKLPC